MIDSTLETISELTAQLEDFKTNTMNQLQAMVDKVVFVGTVAALLILVLIAIIIILRITGSVRKRKRELEQRKIINDLKKERELLREEREYYERRNIAGNRDDLGYNERKYGRGEYRDSWTPKKKA